METATYYNTTRLTTSDLMEAIEKARIQNDRVLLILKTKKYPRTASDIHSTYQAWFTNCPLTSIRRALTTLSHDWKVIKCSDMGMGIYGKLTHKWAIDKDYIRFCEMYKDESDNKWQVMLDNRPIYFNSWI